MRNGHQFKTWNIVDTALTRYATGHHYWETKSLVDELVRRGERVCLFSHRDAPTAEQISGAKIVPTFSLEMYVSVSNDPAWGTLENFFVHNRSLHNDLAAVDESLFAQSLTLFPTLREYHLLGLFRWLGAMRQEPRPKVAICLVPPRDWTETDHSVRLYKTLWKGCPPALQKEIAIFWRTPQQAEMFTKHVGMPARVFPFPAPEEIFSARPSSAGTFGEPMMVSFVGGARQERGNDLIADVVKQCAGSGVRFFIQTRKESTGSDASASADVSALPHVRLHEGALEREDYYRAIASSLVLLPYRPINYRWRDSGIYHEAKLLGAPVLVSAGTWMADEVAGLGNGLVIEHFSAAAIVDAILRAQRELPALRAAAVRVAEECRRIHGVGRCLDAIAGAFG